MRVLLRESRRVCSICGTARCGRPHGWRYRKRVQDLSTGEVFERVPILRVKFCDGSAPSLMPAVLWRGRSTLDSVLETVARVLRDGIAPAHEWTTFAGTGESVVSRRTLQRWSAVVRTRVLGAAWSWLGPRLPWRGPDPPDAARQLDTLLDPRAGSVLLAFRAATGRAVLDKATPPRPVPSCAARRVAGRRAPSPPHDRSSPLRPRGSWWPPPRRRGPPPDPHGGPRDD